MCSDLPERLISSELWVTRSFKYIITDIRVKFIPTSWLVHKHLNMCLIVWISWSIGFSVNSLACPTVYEISSCVCLINTKDQDGFSTLKFCIHWVFIVSVFLWDRRWSWFPLMHSKLLRIFPGMLFISEECLHHLLYSYGYQEMRQFF